jgi:2,3-bisphosphoglycerate-independent phosphoglycerate mutase
LEPIIINRGRKAYQESRIKENDAIIFTNLRSDRARQLTKCFAQKDFNEKNPGAFKRQIEFKNVLFCALTDFGPDLSRNIVTAFPGAKMIGTLPFVMGNYRQTYIAETEKYAHVTYFINGGYSDPVNREKRVRIPSVIIDSYAKKPEMSVDKITKRIIDLIEKKHSDFIVANFANPDMVGHTGNLPATIKAIERVDKCLGKIYKEIIKKKGTLIITADHGNAEQMIDPQTNEIFVEHTTNPVPFIFINNKFKDLKFKNNGCLADIAPTIYDFLGVEANGDVTGISLIKK